MSAVQTPMPRTEAIAATARAYIVQGGEPRTKAAVGEGSSESAGMGRSFGRDSPARRSGLLQMGGAARVRRVKIARRRGEAAPVAAGRPGC